MKLLNKIPVFLLTSACIHLGVQARAQTSPSAASGRSKTSSASSVEQLSASLQTISRQVEPSVVQIFSSALSIENDSARGGGVVATQQRSSGSGVLISSDGYIVTNGHVVEGARKLWVRLNGAVPNLGSHLVNAKLIGIDRQTDLAVIKIDLTGLPLIAERQCPDSKGYGT